MIVQEEALQQVQENEQPFDEVTASDAGQLLAIGHAKLSRLLRAWEQQTGQGLPFRRAALDRRVILIKRQDIETLLLQSQGVTVEQARHALGVSAQKIKQLVDAGALPLRENPLHNNKRLVDPARYEALLAERKLLHRRRGNKEAINDN